RGDDPQARSRVEAPERGPCDGARLRVRERGRGGRDVRQGRRRRLHRQDRALRCVLGAALRDRERPGRKLGRPLRRALSAAVPSLPELHVGASGWSYPSWRGGFYPAGADPKTFLSFYAERFDTVELNTTGYRLPAEDQFARWAAQTPDGFTFAVKMPLTRLDRVGTFVERMCALGDRLGPLRITVPSPPNAPARAGPRGSRRAPCRWRPGAPAALGQGGGGAAGAAPRANTSAGGPPATPACGSRRIPTTTCARSRRVCARPRTSTSATR